MSPTETNKSAPDATSASHAGQKKAKPANPEIAVEGTTKLAQFLASKKIDARRVLAASHELERLRPEDRTIRLAKRKPKGDGEKAGKETRKPRSGRPVTDRAIRAALSGAEAVSGPNKTRIVRAVNHVLEQKKQEKIDLRTLF